MPTMSSSPSDYDISDSSCSGTSHMTNSPVYQIPQLTTELSEMSCTAGPFLRIIDQPQNRFRFRYVSELVGTHGCLVSSTAGNNTKRYPSVELVNYTDKALIRCTLAQHNNHEEHPHKLHDEEDRDVSQIVPEHGSYMVGFRGIGIVHTAKSEVKKKCKNLAKQINFNMVRLKFSAHDVQTDEEICAPVFSEPIRNIKSAATNDLKIVRMSRTCGSPSGGDDVFIFVEKVNKKHVNIRFFELDESGQRSWEGVGQFTPNDVHHQYAIAFRTPAYKDRKTAEDVSVFIELLRTTDGNKSEPVQFKYKAEEFYKQTKRRKICASNRVNNNCLKIVQQAPVAPDTNKMAPYVFNHQKQAESDAFQILEPLSIHSLHELSYTASPTYDSVNDISETSQSPLANPMWGSETYVTTTAAEQIVDMESSELLQNMDPQTLVEDVEKFANVYYKMFTDLFPEETALDSVEFQSLFVSDSGISPDIQFESDFDTGSVRATACGSTVAVKTQAAEELHAFASDEYSAYYKVEDGAEVKKLIKELCEMIKNKKGFKKQEIRERLELLFEKRLSNGDTFLHMTLYSDPTCVYSIVNIMNIVKANYLLDCCNDQQQTPLHLAVLYDMSKIVSFLIAKGADPMLKDARGYNAIHYAVKFGSCLEPLLRAIKKNDVTCNINDYNDEKQSALHMAVIEDSGRSARLLLQHGASYSVRDEYGRTPLHLAAYDDSFEVTKALLDFIPPSDVDVTDNSGNTALQIVCGGTVRDHSVMISTLLLEKQANPITTENGGESAWRLVRNKPALRAVLWDYIPAELKDGQDTDDDVFVSADEGECCDDITST